MIRAGDGAEGGGHEIFGVVFGLLVEVLSDSTGRCGRHKDVVVEITTEGLQFLVIFEVFEVEFPEDVLHGDVFAGFLPVEIGLSLLDVLLDVPGVQGLPIPDD